MSVPIYTCKRCGHEWAGRQGRPKPKTCPHPKCRSPYWDRERTKGVKPSGR
ncbi:MAG: hypothetical protein A4E30_01682 [Methanomassiliicoccales archaeon PtaB.Bin215]|nr:MAG: hypothetical protein A4E30_01682 [Methanomassiliicoccales archaeon PtaB.Bin215]